MPHNRPGYRGLGTGRQAPVFRAHSFLCICRYTLLEYASPHMKRSPRRQTAAGLIAVPPLPSAVLPCRYGGCAYNVGTPSNFPTHRASERGIRCPRNEYGCTRRWIFRLFRQSSPAASLAPPPRRLVRPANCAESKLERAILTVFSTDNPRHLVWSCGQHRRATAQQLYMYGILLRRSVAYMSSWPSTIRMAVRAPDYGSVVLRRSSL